MNAQEIADILSHDIYSIHNFQGVFPRDVFISLDQWFPHSKSQVYQYICNLDESSLPGSHWVVVECNNKNKEIFYFDSYGLPPLHSDLIKKMTSKANYITWNSYPLQSTDTNVCGQYCILFCLFRARGLSYDKIIDLLYHDSKTSSHTRDHMIYALIKHKYPLILANFKTKIHDLSMF